MNFEDLTDEQREKARACTTPEDLIALAQSEGVALSDEELSAVSGGGWGSCSDVCNAVCRDDADQCSTYCPTAWHA